MVGFDAIDFEKIMKQIEFADLTEKQITDLLKALQKKSQTLSIKRGKLTQEERLFFLCCNQQRSFAKGEDTGKIVCPECNSVYVVKNGSVRGMQRYKCKVCGKFFGASYGTLVYNSKLSINQWLTFIRLTIQGESCRTISREMGINKTTVLHNRHRMCSSIKQFSHNNDDFISLAEVDEFYYPLSFKDKKDPKFFLENLGRMPHTHMSLKQRIEYVEKAGYKFPFLTNLEDNERERRYELSAFVDAEALSSQSKFSRAINEMTSNEKVVKVLKTLKEQPKKLRGISHQQVCCLTCVDSSQNHFLEATCVGKVEPKHIEKNLLSSLKDNVRLVTDGLRAYKTVANKHNIPLHQVPSSKHSKDGYNLALLNGYHRNLSVFLRQYYGVSSKYLDYYLALFYWKEKSKSLTYEEQAYEILTLLANQGKKIPLHKLKDREYSFDLKGILGNYKPCYS